VQRARRTKVSPPPSGGRLGRNNINKSRIFCPSPQRGEVGRGDDMNKSRVFRPTPLPTSLRRNARALRRNMTDAERLLWSGLRMGQLGFRFRQQHPIAPYVIDFYCIERRLAIELDGGQHNESAGIASDRHRSARLRSKASRHCDFGITTFSTTSTACCRLFSSHPGPHPILPPLGKGAIIASPVSESIVYATLPAAGDSR
jgi:very-short-patch-repair endonuclease